MIGVNIVGISILGILLLFIFFKRKKETCDYLLILTILLFALVLLTNIWISQSGLTLPKLILTYLINTLLFPTFLIYGLVLIDEEHKVRRRWWWVFSFAIFFNLFILIDVVFISDYSTAEKAQVLFQSPPLIHTLMYKALYIFIIVVSIWFLKKIKRYQNEIKNQYSSVELIHLNWFRNFTYVYLSLQIIELLLFLALDLGLQKDVSIIIAFTSTTMVLAVLYLSFNGIRQYTLAEFHESLEPQDKETVPGDELKEADTKLPAAKYKTSSLSKEELERIYSEISKLFDRDKVYLDPQLKIQNLTDHLQLSTHKISQAINAVGGTSFFDFVNGFRVNHLKGLLSNPENRKFTILALGIESGFNSKATLNRIFKQKVQISPKKFQKKTQLLN